MPEPPDSPPPQTTDREARYNEFVSLLARHDQSIRRFVRSLLPGADGIDDVIQETALECWRKYDTFQPENPANAADDFVRWACVIGRYKALSWQRDHARDRLVFRENIFEQLSDAALSKTAAIMAEQNAVEACLNELTADDRRLLLSVYSPGESIARIAKETNQKARRLYSQLNALRNSLLNCVQQRLAGDPNNA